MGQQSHISVWPDGKVLMWNTPQEYWFPLTNQFYTFPHKTIILMSKLSKLLVNQVCYCCSLQMFQASRTQLCICYLDIQSRDVKYCQVNQLGNCAMYVAQSCCGWSSMWLFLVATIHVGTWRRKIKHSSWTTPFLLHTAGPDRENINMFLLMEIRKQIILCTLRRSCSTSNSWQPHATLITLPFKLTPHRQLSFIWNSFLTLTWKPSYEDHEIL
jgi:hypothetical protein